MPHSTNIAIIGIACIYPGANDTKEYWESILCKRRGFREIPDERMPFADYGSAHRSDRDKTYARKAALIDGFEFDWKRHRIPKVAYEATDTTHWLALQTAIDAVAASGIDLDAIGRDNIGVVVGNSLTGEISRANLLRLRWPYVRRAIIEGFEAGALSTPLSTNEQAALLADIEASFKAPFPMPNEDTLAGTLSNVIAGRICNFMDLHGGGYTVDGACASSLLAVATACDALSNRRADLMLAGGVDISLDPLELVGFARAGALTEGEMRVYDRNSSGFIAGEGCGFVVLMREQDAARHGIEPWALIDGWGISSDGHGGITAPRTETQFLAIRRCYESLAFSPRELDFVEGHGTGTPVGDPVELGALIRATREEKGSSTKQDVRPIGVTSVKTLIGHAKAAAGIAGFIKAAIAVNQRVLPPMAGLKTPAQSFESAQARIYPIATGAVSEDRSAPMRAGVSSAGFGGINCHIALSSPQTPPKPITTLPTRLLLASAQSAELFVASGDSPADVTQRLSEIATRAKGMAEGELVDLAADCAARDGAMPWRAAVIAGTVDELAGNLHDLIEAIRVAGANTRAPGRSLFRQSTAPPRVGFLFPGQGSQFLHMGAPLAPRHDWAAARATHWDERFTDSEGTPLTDLIAPPLERADREEVIAGWEARLRDTRTAQPAICMTSLQWLQWLRGLGVTASIAAGHSLGEIGAMVAAEILSEDEAIEVLRVRAAACAATGDEAGAMAGLQCGADRAGELLARIDGYAVIANDNAPDQTVIAGDPKAIDALLRVAKEVNITTTPLNVSNAFHSNYMHAAEAALLELARTRAEERSPSIPFVSGLHGAAVTEAFEPWFYLAEQVVAPVQFRKLSAVFPEYCDVILELGPGKVLGNLVKRTLSDEIAVYSLEENSPNRDAVRCRTIGALFTHGCLIDWHAYYADRFYRPFVPASERHFIANPCELRQQEIPPGLQKAIEHAGSATGHAPSGADTPARAITDDGQDALSVLRDIVVRESGYDLDMITPESRLADDLNLDSIKIAEVAAMLDHAGFSGPDAKVFATASIGEIAAASRRDKPAPESGQDTAPVTAGPSDEGISMPTTLPVSGYRIVWQPEDREFATANLHGPIAIIYAEDRTIDAMKLAEPLGVTGARIIIDPMHDGISVPVVADAARIIALPPIYRLAADRFGAAENDAVEAFFGRVGQWLAAGAASLLFIGRPDPGFGAESETKSGAAPEAPIAPIFGFAQSVFLDMPDCPVVAMEVAEDAIDVAKPLVDAAFEPGITLLRITAQGACTRPTLVPHVPGSDDLDPTPPLEAGDVLVVSGGAKGITAACALALAKETGARSALFGSSKEDDPEIGETLTKFSAQGLKATYVRCDVTDPTAVARAIKAVKRHYGVSKIRGLVHGAGVNRPASVQQLDGAKLRREYAVKTIGFSNLLSALDLDGLRLCVGFGSVIGTVGMRNNAGYALANETLAGQLSALGRAYPNIRVVCPAYSVWADIGMGAKFGVASALEKLRVASVPVDAGIDWLVRCCRARVLPSPLIIAAPMHGLATWRLARHVPETVPMRFVEDLVAFEPESLLVAQPVLTTDRDPWLPDHDFRGSLLLPLVFALRAMAEASIALAGAGRTGVGRVTGIRGIDIQRPIIAVPNGKTPIEVDTRYTGAPGIYDARVGSPGSAWSEPAFAATLTLADTPPPGEETDPGWSGSVPSPELGSCLYDAILFQGPLFQRILSVDSLDLSDPIHRRGTFTVRREAAHAASIPDTYFLDALLQSLQILVPKDLCLPVGIDDIIVFAPAFESGLTTVSAEIVEKTENGYVSRIVALDSETGRMAAILDGYKTTIVERFGNRPDADAFFDPIALDRESIAPLAEACKEIGIHDLALGATDDGDQEIRHTAAANRIDVRIGIAPSAIGGDDSGKQPILQPGDTPRTSVSHDSGRSLTIAGSGIATCALRKVARRPTAWIEILPETYHGLWRTLTEWFHHPEYAGAATLALHECLTRAAIEDADVRIMDVTATRDNVIPDDVIPLEVTDGRIGGSALISIREFVLTGAMAVAVFSGNETGADDAAAPRRATDNALAPSHPIHYERDEVLTFKDVLPPLRVATAPVFFRWLGDVREHAMSEIREPLAEAFGVGGKGMVTNFSEIRIFGPPVFSAGIRAWVWIERILATSPSTFELGFQWAEIDADGRPVSIAGRGRQRLTWVNIGPEGHVAVEPLPAFFSTFLAARTPTEGARPFSPPEAPGKIIAPEIETSLWRRNADTNDGEMTASIITDTDNGFSNFVGNIYFSHYALWLDRACQSILQAASLPMGCYYAVRLRIDHSAEAMPGDRIETRAKLTERRSHGCDFAVEFVNLTANGQRIATGNTTYLALTERDKGYIANEIPVSMAHRNG
uniref:Enediyne polyketide synthase n=1 Tax=Candidatus Kentrum sp. LFY TaxID=2126342 RepID=A0A450WEL9_9GAMM|nr:MAG: enediyne polyketide synthase [Candidatus Kentron sp. LFY]